MKTFYSALLALTLVSGAASARSLHPDTFKQAAPVLRQLEVTNVANEGVVLRERHQHPFTEFLVGLPVTINTGDACTQFVGQQTNRNDSRRATQPRITAVGASNPLMDACIAVMPEPVNTNLSLAMSILTGGFVPAKPLHTQIVEISGAGLFVVELNIHENTVKIAPLMPEHR